MGRGCGIVVFAVAESSGCWLHPWARLAKRGSFLGRCAIAQLGRQHREASARGWDAGVSISRLRRAPSRLMQAMRFRLPWQLPHWRRLQVLPPLPSWGEQAAQEGAEEARPRYGAIAADRAGGGGGWRR